MEFQCVPSILVRSCFHLCVLELHKHRSPVFWNSCTARTFSSCFLRGLLGANLAASNFLHFSAKFFHQCWMSWIPMYSAICIPFFLIAMSSQFRHELRDGCLKRWILSFIFRNSLPIPLFHWNCDLSGAHSLGTLTACGMSFLNARVPPILRTNVGKFDCFFRNQFFAVIMVIRLWNKYFVHAVIRSLAHHEPGPWTWMI